MSCHDRTGSSPGLFGGGVLYGKVDVGILRTDPTTYGFEIETIRKGESVKVISRTSEKMRVGRTQDYWYLVQKGNKVKGWIYGASLSRIPTGTEAEVVEGPDMVVVQANLPGEWWEVNADDSTGFRRLKFEPRGNELSTKVVTKEDRPVTGNEDRDNKEVILAESGKCQYFYGKSGGAVIEYHIDPKTRKIRLKQDSPVGVEFEFVDLGEEFRLLSARGDKKFAFKKGYDTDEEENQNPEQEKVKEEPDVQNTKSDH